MATAFMNLNLPVVTVDLGPEWANEINAAFEKVDEHDHSSGKGVKVKTAGIDINSDLTFNNKRAVSVFSVQFQPVSSALSGASNTNSLSSFNGNLYWVNGAGVSVQITNGGSVVSTPASVQTVQTVAVNTNLTINPSDTFVYLIVDTTATRTITLPLAASVAAGRIYILKDSSGQSNTNPITLQPSGGDLIDGAASYQISSNNSTTWIVGDGATKWSIS